MWKQAKTEIDIVRSVWEDEFHPSFDKLATNIYGPKSKLFQLFEEELELSYEQFCRFLATFYAASSRSTPASRLLEDENCNSTGLMKKEEYYRLIMKIKGLCGVGNGDDDSLWIKLECLFNSFAKKKNFCKKRPERIISYFR